MASLRPAVLISRAVLVIASVLFTVGMVELGARVLLPPSWYLGRRPPQMPEPPLKRVGRAIHMVRAPLPPAAADADELRIMFLGDSFTFGNGLEDDTNVFVRRIERELNEHPPDPRYLRYVCFNAGIPGSMTTDWMRVFEDINAEFRPHVVIVVFFLRDGALNAGSIPLIAKIAKKLKARNDSSFVFRHSRLYRFFVEGAEQRRLGREYLANIDKGYLGGARDTEEWKHAQLNLMAVQDDAHRAGAVSALVIFPVLFDLREDYVLQRTMDEIESAAHFFKMPVLSLLPAFVGERAEALWVSLSDQHPNEKGHEIAARAMLPFVVDLVARTSPAKLAWPAAPGPMAATRSDIEQRAPPDIERQLQQLRKARGVELDELKQALVGRGKALIPRLVAAFDDPDLAVPALRLFFKFDKATVGEAMAPFLEAVTRNGIAVGFNAMAEKALGTDAMAQHIVEGLHRSDTVIGTLMVVGRVNLAGAGLRSTWPHLGDVAPVIADLLMSSTDVRLSRVATVALGRLGAAAAATLTRFVSSQRPEERRKAATALGYLGPNAPPGTVDPLVSLLADADPEVRAAAARALWQIAPISRPAEPTLAKLENDVSPEVTRWARRAREELKRLAHVETSAKQDTR